MSIAGIKEIDFAQAYLGKALSNSKSDSNKYIAKDFVLELGGVKIKLKASDSLRDVVRKINLQSHVTGVRGKAVKGNLALESTSKERGQPLGITLPKKDSGEGFPVNANQIIANYLASLPPKNAVTTQTEDVANSEQEAWQYLNNIYNLCYLNEEIEEENYSVEGEGSVNHSIDSEEFDNDVVIFNENVVLAQVPAPIYSNVNSYNNSLNNSIIMAPNSYLSQSMIAKLNALINEPLDKENCENFYKDLSNQDRNKLIVVLDKKITKFQTKPSNVSVSVPNKPNYQDRFYFCIKQIKAGKINPF